LEVDDLDLDADMAESVTVIEWGSGKVEELAEDRLMVRIDREESPGATPGGTGPAAEVGRASAGVQEPADAAGGARLIQVTGIGDRWADLRL
jgi:tRNA threonylcarbamoyladenosine biosynthesis protein TsaE